MGVLTAPQRFAARLVDGPLFEGTPCKLWTPHTRSGGANSDNQRGRFWDDLDDTGHRRSWIPRRYAWWLARGVDLPGGLYLYARCRNPRCVSDQHAVALCIEGVAGQTYRDNLVISPTCPHGHLWTRQNRQANNGRASFRCAACNRDNMAAWKAAGGVGRTRTLADLSPQCAHGHDRTEANTRFNPHGAVVCRVCARNRRREWGERQKARA